MKKISLMPMLLVAFLSLGAAAADRLAIAEPVNKGGLNAQEVEAVWNMLEATVDGGYELISRSALKSMMTEIGLTASSDLVNLNSAQKARLGEVKTVKYLLVPTVSRFGNRINFTLITVDASTGNIDPGKKAAETFNSLDELADKLKDTLSEIGLDTAAKKRGTSALLYPVIKVPDAPEYLGEDFNVLLEATLLNSGVKLQNLRSVSAILRKNRIGNPDGVEPAMYRRIGELLRVDYLIQARITRFSCRFNRIYIEVTRSWRLTCIGDFEGNIRIISASDGSVAGSIPFRLNVDFADVTDTENWTVRDYNKYLIDRAMPAVAGAVLNVLKK